MNPRENQSIDIAHGYKRPNLKRVDRIESNNLPPPIQQTQKLLPRLRATPHTSKHTTRRSRAARLLHTAHHHAQMRALHDDRDTLRLEDLGDGERDLLRQPFLDLETTREHFGETGEFGKADDATIRDVANVHL